MEIQCGSRTGGMLNMYDLKYTGQKGDLPTVILSCAVLGLVSPNKKRIHIFCVCVFL